MMDLIGNTIFSISCYPVHATTKILINLCHHKMNFDGEWLFFVANWHGKEAGSMAVF